MPDGPDELHEPIDPQVGGAALELLALRPLARQRELRGHAAAPELRDRVEQHGLSLDPHESPDGQDTQRGLPLGPRLHRRAEALGIDAHAKDLDARPVIRLEERPNLAACEIRGACDEARPARLLR